MLWEEVLPVGLSQLVTEFQAAPTLVATGWTGLLVLVVKLARAEPLALVALPAPVVALVLVVQLVLVVPVEQLVPAANFVLVEHLAPVE